MANDLVDADAHRLGEAAVVEGRRVRALGHDVVVHSLVDVVGDGARHAELGAHIERAAADGAGLADQRNLLRRKRRRHALELALVLDARVAGVGVVGARHRRWHLARSDVRRAQRARPAEARGDEVARALEAGVLHVRGRVRGPVGFEALLGAEVGRGRARLDASGALHLGIGGAVFAGALVHHGGRGGVGLRDVGGGRHAGGGEGSGMRAGGREAGMGERDRGAQWRGGGSAMSGGAGKSVEVDKRYFVKRKLVVV